MKITRLVVSLAFAFLAVTCVRAQNVVVNWDAIASTTIITNAKEASGTSSVWFAYVHLAVFDAVNSIDRRFQPYLFTTQVPAGASQDAAAAAAAHRVLVPFPTRPQTFPQALPSARQRRKL